jgi:cytosine/adenosine deaminase-related metal-dependent hydrolase
MLRHLAERGFLSRRANLVHAIWLEPEDLDLIAANEAAVVHNPVSNARLGSGLCRLPEMIARGVRVALGTDSACCNDSNNLLDTMKWAALVHNNTTSIFADWVGPERAFTLATRGGADALGLGAVTGAIAVGLAADLTLLRLNSPGFAPLIDPVRQLVQAENGAAVDTVLVAGEVVLRDGRATRIDEHALWAEAGELAARRLSINKGVYAAAAELSEPIRRMYRRIDQEPPR